MQDGSEVVDHAEKATVLWNSFKERFGQSLQTEIPIEILHMVQPAQDLTSLSEPFTEQEIDLVVSNLPIDKAPGPDGFNGKFMKSCWHIIKHDFYRLSQEFHEHNIPLQCINDLLITLIPKKTSLETPNDFRPISLLNSALKLLTKLLANRLQKVILDLVHKNQYGFIKSRTIQDCLA
jgi:hypothetical protein